MKAKEVKPINFIYFNTRSKISELGRFVGIMARELHRDAVLNDLEVTGPVYWNYHDFTGNPEHEFNLEIALPIAEIPEQYVGKFQLKRTDPFYCVAYVHDGSWFDLSTSYGKIMTFMEERSVMPISVNREMYINMDFKNPEANVTEIQVGISKEAYMRITTAKGQQVTMSVH